MVGVAEQLVQIAGRDAAIARDRFGIEGRIAQVPAHEGFDAGQMRRAHGRAAGGERALIGLERQHQEIDELLADHGAHLVGHCIEAVRDQMQHVGEEAAGAVGGIELQRAEAVGPADAPAERLGLDLHDPQIGRLVMAELIRLVAALEDEAARRAVHVLAALREEDLGARRHRDQEMLVALGAEMMRQAAIAQRLGGEARQRDVAQMPVGDLAGKAVGLAEGEVEREIGLGDRLVPVPAALAAAPRCWSRCASSCRSLRMRKMLRRGARRTQ